MLRRARLSGPAGPLLGVAVGLLAATVLTLLQDSTYRADASIVLVRAGQPPGSDPALAQATETAAELFDSRAVAESAIRNLGLDETPSGLVDRLDVDAQEGSSLLRVSALAPSAEEARRIAQEASEVATVLFNDRFGPETVASIWEPANAEAVQVSPKPSRNLALGVLIGALVGFGLVIAASFRPPPPPAPGSAAAAKPPVPAPAVAPEPASVPSGQSGFGEWTLGDVERLVAEHGSSFPDQREELELYVATLRGVAGPDGRLPGDVDLVIEDVFADLIARSRG
jgi:capsular polysaccharide biosynthesis protein